MITVKKSAIRYKDSDGTMKDSGVLCQVDVVYKDSDVVDLRKCTHMQQAFRNAIFADGTELTILTPITWYMTTYAMKYAFNNVKGLNTLKLVGNDENVSIDMEGLLYESQIETLDLTDFKAKFKKAYDAFNKSTKLKYILGELDFSEAESVHNAFSQCTSLEEVGFAKNTLKLSISFSNSRLLSNASIKSIIEALADLTGTTAQTLTFHADVKAKLTEEQIATITSKNWTLA